MHRIRRKQSKRLSLHDKHKIEKRVSQHHKKMRRVARGVHKGKPVSSIPNSCPFKLELLQEMQARKEDQQLLKVQLRERRKQLEHNSEFHTLTSKAQSPSTSQAIQEVINSLGDVDAVVEVLEARDPEFYRCPDVENWAKSQGKVMVLVLHKADLVESETVQEWVQYYQKEFPCIPTSKSLKTVKGADRRNTRLKDAILEALNLGAVSAKARIAVLGYPNVGKSTVANIILGAKRMRVSAQPGSTTDIQTATIDTHIGLTVIDTPALTALGANDRPDDPLVSLKRVTNLDSISDPFTPTQGLLMKLPSETLQKQFKIESYESIQDFLGAVAKSQGLYKRPGMVDYESAAKVVLFDWMSGKIGYCEKPVS